jgi:hypothetical protein
MSKNERLDKEVHGLLTTIRDLEREHSALKDKFAKYESVMVFHFLRCNIDNRINIDLRLFFLMEMECWYISHALLNVAMLSKVFDRFLFKRVRRRSRRRASIIHSVLKIIKTPSFN